GFELAAPVSPSAAAIASGMRAAIAERRVCGVWAVDGFNFMPMLNNLLFALDAASADAPVDPLPWRRAPFTKRFDEAGLWVVNRGRFYAIVGSSKGGTVSVFDKEARRLGAKHSGLVAARGPEQFTSHLIQRAPYARWNADGTAVELDVAWKALKTTVFGPWLFLGF